MIIAELCGNWNGDKNLLKDMVQASSQSGARFAKIQTFYAEDLADDWKEKDYDRIKSLELTEKEHRDFVSWCKSAHIEPMTSVYSFKYAQMLWDAGFRHIKIGSAQCCDQDLVCRYIAAGFNVTISTGGHSVLEIPKYASLYAALHCVSSYPTQKNEMNLRRIIDLRLHFPNPNTLIGYSDHSSYFSNDGVYALSFGAQILERHFSLLPPDATKDGAVSCDVTGLRYLAKFVGISKEERIKTMPGVGLISCPQTKEEVELIKKYKTRWKQ